MKKLLTYTAIALTSFSFANESANQSYWQWYKQQRQLDEFAQNIQYTKLFGNKEDHTKLLETLEKFGLTNQVNKYSSSTAKTSYYGGIIGTLAVIALIQVGSYGLFKHPKDPSNPIPLTLIACGNLAFSSFMALSWYLLHKRFAVNSDSKHKAFEEKVQQLAKDLGSH